MAETLRDRHRRELEELDARVKARADQRELGYRGVYNAGNGHGAAKLMARRGVPMKLEPRRVHAVKGRKSRRLRKNQWVPK